MSQRLRWGAYVSALVVLLAAAVGFGGRGTAVGSAPVAPGSQEDPAVAFDGVNYLVVWDDARAGPADIYGARVTPQGEVLDPGGFPISIASCGQGSPEVAFNGTNYLVAWWWVRIDYPYDEEIKATRVTPQGEVLDRYGIMLTFDSVTQRVPSVAFDGVNYLVSWMDYHGDIQIYGGRVTPAGQVLELGGFPISTAAYVQGWPTMAFAGTNYLVAWEDNRSGMGQDIYGARVTPSATVLDQTGIPIATGQGAQFAPAVAFGLPNYLLAWGDFLSSDLYGARVTPA